MAPRNLFAIGGDLSVIDGILTRGDRIVIPDPLRREILDRIHDGHLGITKCHERATQCVWWPGINKNIQERVVKCRHCCEKQPSHPNETLFTLMLPDRPFQKIGVDICEFKGHPYLVSVDYYSRYIDISSLSEITSFTVVCKMKNIFAQQ